METINYGRNKFYEFPLVVETGSRFILIGERFKLEIKRVNLNWRCVQATLDNRGLELILAELQ
jgi:hypothetical protein